MITNSVLVDVENLNTHFFTETGVVRAVNGVSFQIKQGETLGVLGESGCGKSVTGFSILRLINPPGRIVDGSITYYRDDEAIDLLKLDARSERMRQIRGGEIAMIFQEPMTSLDPLYTVGDQIIESIRAHETISKLVARRRAIELLERVRMPQPNLIVDQYPHQLSGGMRQRAMIAIALSCAPKLLIADEPTTALDVTTEAQILELLRDLQKEFGMAMLFITHDLGVIAEMASEVIVMYLGRVVEHSNIRALFSDPKHPYTRALLNSIPKVGQKNESPLHAIRGSVPSPFAIPPGCSFSPRCDHFMLGICNVRVPKMTLLPTGQSVECFLYELPETAQKVGQHG